MVVVAGLPAQIAALNAQLPKDDGTPPPVIVIGAGKVGHAAARSLKAKGLRVHVIDRSEAALAPIARDVGQVFPGDAADRELLDQAGILAARSLLLTTNNDAMNIYLAVFCRRLNRELRIVSRITHERNWRRFIAPGRTSF